MSNSKIVDFKEFVRANLFLISYVKNGSKSWQDLYEMFDMYGDDQESWNKYLDDSNDRSGKNSNSGSGSSFKLDDLVKMAKNVDIDKVQEGITSLQKTLSLFGDLFISKNASGGKGYNPRPLYRRFED